MLKAQAKEKQCVGSGGHLEVGGGWVKKSEVKLIPRFLIGRLKPDTMVNPGRDVRE